MNAPFPSFHVLINWLMINVFSLLLFVVENFMIKRLMKSHTVFRGMMAYKYVNVFPQYIKPPPNEQKTYNVEFKSN